MNTISDVIHAKQLIIAISALAICPIIFLTSCVKEQNGSLDQVNISLTTVNSNASVRIEIYNGLKQPVTINRFIAPGYPTSFVTYHSTQQGNFRPSNYLGSTLIVDPVTELIHLDPGAFYGYELKLMDIKDALGIRDKCFDLYIVYSNVSNQHYSKLKMQSNKINLCS